MRGLLPDRTDATHHIAGPPLRDRRIRQFRPLASDHSSQGFEVELPGDRDDSDDQATIDIRQQGLEHLLRVETQRLGRLETEVGGGRVVNVTVAGETDARGGEGEGCGGDHALASKSSAGLDKLDPRTTDKLDPRTTDKLDPRMIDRLDPRMTDKLDPRMTDTLDPRIIDMLGRPTIPPGRAAWRW